MDDEEELRTAYHEAGHCVMAVLCGARAEFATILPTASESPEEIGFFGRAEIHWPRRSSTADKLSVILSGPVAELIYRNEPLHPAFVKEHVEDWATAWSLARPHAADDQKCMLLLEQIVAKLYRTLSTDAYWAAIAAVQDLLMAHQEIEHEQIEYEVRAWLNQ
jgi:hypothetical protein